MRKITELAVKAFFSGQNLKQANMQVQHTNGIAFMYLHGNRIAKGDSSGVTLWDCGWKTVTTKERLNGILGYLDLPRINQSKGVWYQGDWLWESGKTFNRN